MTPGNEPDQMRMAPSVSETSGRKLRVAFCHPDLGIGETIASVANVVAHNHAQETVLEMRTFARRPTALQSGIINGGLHLSTSTLSLYRQHLSLTCSPAPSPSLPLPPPPSLFHPPSPPSSFPIPPYPTRRGRAPRGGRRLRACEPRPSGGRLHGAPRQKQMLPGNSGRWALQPLEMTPAMPCRPCSVTSSIISFNLM